MTGMPTALVVSIATAANLESAPQRSRCPRCGIRPLWRMYDVPRPHCEPCQRTLDTAATLDQIRHRGAE
jgi:uncharacterized protein (DUF983 family)